MHSQRSPPRPLKRSYSGESHSSYASAATTVSRASSKLLFGEIPLTPATTADGRSIRSNGSICNLVLSASSVFLRFWLNDQCRDNLLEHLEPEDLSSFRLVCHDFSSKAAPRLFEALSVTFKTSSFSKPARIEALSRIGRHVKTFTFHMPHGPESFLPPLVDPETGAEKQFIYEPQVQNPPSGPVKDKTPKYGSWAMQDLLIKQYPPLFHAATNVPAFVATFSQLTNLTHLRISCPGSPNTPRYRRSAVDYALISLRIAVERAPLYSLSSLSLHPMHPGGLLYLHPMHGFGSTPSSAKRWGQIRNLSIHMDDVAHTRTRAPAHAQSLAHLRILHAYLHTLSPTLTGLVFRWNGTRGPCPVSLDTEPCLLETLSTHEYRHGYGHGHNKSHHTSNHNHTSNHTSPNSSPRHHPPPPPPPRTLHFPRLTTTTLSNILTSPPQLASFISTHKRSLCDFNFDNVKLSHGDWDAALAPLAPLASRARGEEAHADQEGEGEVWDVPLMLSPVEEGAGRVCGGAGAGGRRSRSKGRGVYGDVGREGEIRVPGRLGGDANVLGERERERIDTAMKRDHALSRWLGRGWLAGSGLGSPPMVQQQQQQHRKPGWGDRLARLTSWGGAGGGGVVLVR